MAKPIQDKDEDMQRIYDSMGSTSGPTRKEIEDFVREYQIKHSKIIPDSEIIGKITKGKKFAEDAIANNSPFIPDPTTPMEHIVNPDYVGQEPEPKGIEALPYDPSKDPEVTGKVPKTEEPKTEQPNVKNGEPTEEQKRELENYEAFLDSLVPPEFQSDYDKERYKRLLNEYMNYRKRFEDFAGQLMDRNIPVPMSEKEVHDYNSGEGKYLHMSYDGLPTFPAIPLGMLNSTLKETNRWHIGEFPKNILPSIPRKQVQVEGLRNWESRLTPTKSDAISFDMPQDTPKHLVQGGPIPEGLDPTSPTGEPIAPLPKAEYVLDEEAQKIIAEADKLQKDITEKLELERFLDTENKELARVIAEAQPAIDKLRFYHEKNRTGESVLAPPKIRGGWADEIEFVTRDVWDRKTRVYLQDINRAVSKSSLSKETKEKLFELYTEQINELTNSLDKVGPVENPVTESLKEMGKDFLDIFGLDTGERTQYTNRANIEFNKEFFARAAEVGIAFGTMGASSGLLAPSLFGKAATSGLAKGLIGSAIGSAAGGVAYNVLQKDSDPTAALFTHLGIPAEALEYEPDDPRWEKITKDLVSNVALGGVADITLHLVGKGAKAAYKPYKEYRAGKAAAKAEAEKAASVAKAEAEKAAAVALEKEQIEFISGELMDRIKLTSAIVKKIDGEMINLLERKPFIGELLASEDIPEPILLGWIENLDNHIKNEVTNFLTSKKGIKDLDELFKGGIEGPRHVDYNLIAEKLEDAKARAIGLLDLRRLIETSDLPAKKVEKFFDRYRFQKEPLKEFLKKQKGVSIAPKEYAKYKKIVDFIDSKLPDVKKYYISKYDNPFKEIEDIRSFSQTLPELPYVEGLAGRGLTQKDIDFINYYETQLGYMPHRDYFALDIGVLKETLESSNKELRELHRIIKEFGVTDIAHFPFTPETFHMLEKEVKAYPHLYEKKVLETAREQIEKKGSATVERLLSPRRVSKPKKAKPPEQLLEDEIIDELEKTATKEGLPPSVVSTEEATVKESVYEFSSTPFWKWKASPSIVSIPKIVSTMAAIRGEIIKPKVYGLLNNVGTSRGAIVAANNQWLEYAKAQKLIREDVNIARLKINPFLSMENLQTARKNLLDLGRNLKKLEEEAAPKLAKILENPKTTPLEKGSLIVSLDRTYKQNEKNTIDQFVKQSEALRKKTLLARGAYRLDNSYVSYLLGDPINRIADYVSTRLVVLAEAIGGRKLTEKIIKGGYERFLLDPKTSLRDFFMSNRPRSFSYITPYRAGTDLPSSGQDFVFRVMAGLDEPVKQRVYMNMIDEVADKVSKATGGKVSASEVSDMFYTSKGTDIIRNSQAERIFRELYGEVDASFIKAHSAGKASTTLSLDDLQSILSKHEQMLTKGHLGDLTINEIFDIHVDGLDIGVKELDNIAAEAALVPSFQGGIEGPMASLGEIIPTLAKDKHPAWGAIARFSRMAGNITQTAFDITPLGLAHTTISPTLKKLGVTRKAFLGGIYNDLTSKNPFRVNLGIVKVAAAVSTTIYTLNYLLSMSDAEFREQAHIDADTETLKEKVGERILPTTRSWQRGLHQAASKIREGKDVPDDVLEALLMYGIAVVDNYVDVFQKDKMAELPFANDLARAAQTVATYAGRDVSGELIDSENRPQPDKQEEESEEYARSRIESSQEYLRQTSLDTATDYVVASVLSHLGLFGTAASVARKTVESPLGKSIFSSATGESPVIKDKTREGWSTEERALQKILGLDNSILGSEGLAGPFDPRINMFGEPMKIDKGATPVPFSGFLLMTH